VSRIERISLIRFRARSQPTCAVHVIAMALGLSEIGARAMTDRQIWPPCRRTSVYKQLHVQPRLCVGITKRRLTSVRGFVLPSCFGFRCALAISRQPIQPRVQAREGEAEKL
jgi:hypothetical protein